MRPCLASVATLLTPLFGQRIVAPPSPPGLDASNSYVAAVAQTVFVSKCCPTPNGNATTTASCFCAAPLGPLAVCPGDDEARANAVKMANVAKVLNYTTQARALGAQIIVFAEGALGMAAYGDHGDVASGALAEPLPEPGVVPCNWPEDGPLSASAPALRAISCSARDSNITIVYDMGDLVACAPENPYNRSLSCSECPDDGFMRFNALVAIGDKGELLMKYHKEHRYLAKRCVGREACLKRGDFRCAQAPCLAEPVPSSSAIPGGHYRL